jgi:HPt (histidine-containing phosphotransfer) domain-containing protein
MINNKEFSSHELLKRVGDDKELAEEILGAYLELLPSLISKIETGIKKQDSQLIFKTAHTLNGASANVSATGVRKLALEIEASGKKGNIEFVSVLFEKLNTTVDRTKKEINNFLISPT